MNWIEFVKTLPTAQLDVALDHVLDTAPRDVDGNMIDDDPMYVVLEEMQIRAGLVP